MDDENSMAPGEMAFRIRSMERDLERVERAQATFVTQETFALKLQVSVVEIMSKIDALTEFVSELRDGKSQSHNRLMGSFLLPMLSGLIIAVVGTLVLAGLK